MIPKVATTKKSAASHVVSCRVSAVADNVRQLAEATLRASGHHFLKGVACEFHEGVLVLRGRVPSYYLKQVAQTVVRQIDGVIQIDNRLEVRSES